MRRSHVTRRSDFSVALRAMLNRSSIVISLGLLIEALEPRPEALRIACDCGGGAAGAPARCFRITPSIRLVNGLYAGHQVRADVASGAEVPSRSAGPAKRGRSGAENLDGIEHSSRLEYVMAGLQRRSWKP